MIQGNQLLTNSNQSCIFIYLKEIRKEQRERVRVNFMRMANSIEKLIY